MPNYINFILTVASFRLCVPVSNVALVCCVEFNLSLFLLQSSLKTLIRMHVQVTQDFLKAKGTHSTFVKALELLWHCVCKDKNVKVSPFQGHNLNSYFALRHVCPFIALVLLSFFMCECL